MRSRCGWRLAPAVAGSIRQLLIESTLLFLIGGAAGLALARVMTDALASLLPAVPVPIDLTLPLDGRALAFTLGLSLVAAILSGLAPALHASRAEVVGGLKSDAQGGPERSRLRHAFVVGQVAFSIVLVVGAGLFVRALQRAADDRSRLRSDTASSSPHWTSRWPAIHRTAAGVFARS